MMAKERQEFTRRPFTCSGQAPDCRGAQPFLVAGMFRFSRRQSSNVVRGSIFRLCSLPLTRRVTGTEPSTPSIGVASSVAGGACDVTDAKTGVDAAILAAPICDRNDRRATRPRSGRPFSVVSSFFSFMPSIFWGAIGSLAMETSNLGIKNRHDLEYCCQTNCAQSEGQMQVFSICTFHFPSCSRVILIQMLIGCFLRRDGYTLGTDFRWFPAHR